MSDDETGPARPSNRARVRGFFLDIAPLRHDRDFRWLWAGQAVSGIGNQVTRIALPYQVYVLTHSTLAIAALAAFQLVPLLVFALGAGALADAFDRRRLLLMTQVGQAAGTAALAVLALQPAPSLAAIFAVAAVMASLGAIGHPASASAVPRLVPPDRLPAAIALNQLSFQASSIIGPAIGGILLATVGVAGAYGLDVLTFAASIVALIAIRPLPPLSSAVRPGLAAIAEGLRFARRRRVILSTFAIDLNAMIFGMPVALFPVLALDVFRVGPAGVGLLAAALATGGFLGAAMSGWVTRVERAGRAVAVAVAVWGLAILGFGLATFSFPLALVLLAVAGAADLVSAILRSTIVQLETPDELRGRVTSIHVLVVTGGPRIGDIEAAAVAAAVGAQLSVVSGGLLCVAGVVAVVRAFPELMAHRTDKRPASLLTVPRSKG